MAKTKNIGKKSTKFSLILIIVLAIIAMIGSYMVLTASKISVYVWKTDYPAGTLISSSMFDTVEIDKTMYTKLNSRSGNGYVSTAESDIWHGKYLRDDVRAGEPVYKSNFNTYGSSKAEAGIVGSQSNVAITVPVTNAEAVTPSIKSGTFVNVYAGFVNNTGNGTVNEERLILQKLKVVDVIYTQKENSSTGAPVVDGVTLEVNVNDSVLLNYACEYGQIRLGIVDGANYVPVPLEEVTSNTLNSVTQSVSPTPEYAISE